MKTAVHFSSATDLWETPQAFFDKLHAEFGFETDVCASPENAKCPRYFTAEMDGLAQCWEGVCWMNPPYGREIGHWMKKAWESAGTGGGYGRLPRSRPHGHCLVARLREAGRDPIHSREAQIRRPQELSPVSICGCNIPTRPRSPTLTFD